MYTLVGWSPAVSIAYTTKGYSHSPPASRFSVIPVIRRAAWWWNPSRTLRISPVTTQLLMTYKSTDWATALYISPGPTPLFPSIRAPSLPLTIASKISTGFGKLPSNHCYCRRIVRPRYGKASGGGRVSTFIWNNTLLASKQRCKVSRLISLSSPWLHFSDT